MAAYSSTSTQLSFNLLKAKALDGDFISTSTLQMAFCIKNIGTLSDVFSVIQRHLSQRMLRRVRAVEFSERTDSSDMRNARSALKMLCHGVEKHQPLENDPALIERISNMCPLITKWMTLFLDSTNILSDTLPIQNEDLLRDVSHVVPILFRSTPLWHVFRKENRLFPLIVAAWIRLADLGHAAKLGFQGAFLTAMIAEVRLVPGHRDLTDGAREALSARSTEIAEAMIGCLAAEVDSISLESLRICISTIFYARACSPSARRALASKGVLSYLCLAARRASRQNFSATDKSGVGSCMCLLIQELSVFTRMAHHYVVVALEGRLIETLLRMELTVHDPACFHNADDRHHLLGMIVGLLQKLESFLIYRSSLSSFRKSIRYVESSGLVKKLAPEGHIHLYYSQLKNALAAQGGENSVQEESSGTKRRTCVNPTCSLKGTHLQAHERPQKCSECWVAMYCSRMCQKVHWAAPGGHREQCLKLSHARRVEATLAPPSPRDMDAIYQMVEDDVREHASMIQKLVHGYRRQEGGSMFAIKLDYGCELGDASARPRLSAIPLGDLRKDQEQYSAVEYDDVSWGKCVERARGTGPFIAIAISSMLIDLTNMQRIKERIYPLEIF